MLGLWQQGFIGRCIDSGNPTFTGILAGLNEVQLVFLQVLNAVRDPFHMVLNGWRHIA